MQKNEDTVFQDLAKSRRRNSRAEKLIKNKLVSSELCERIFAALFEWSQKEVSCFYRVLDAVHSNYESAWPGIFKIILSHNKPILLYYLLVYFPEIIVEGTKDDLVKTLCNSKNSSVSRVAGDILTSGGFQANRPGAISDESKRMLREKTWTLWRGPHWTTGNAYRIIQKFFGNGYIIVSRIYFDFRVLADGTPVFQNDIWELLELQENKAALISASRQQDLWRTEDDRILNVLLIHDETGGHAFRISPEIKNIKQAIESIAK